MNVNAVIFFTDVNIHEEYKNLQMYLDLLSEKKFAKKPLSYLATTKTDLKWNNTVEEIQLFANENDLKLCITSLDDLNSIDSMFQRIMDDLIEEYIYISFDSLNDDYIEL